MTSFDRRRPVGRPTRPTPKGVWDGTGQVGRSVGQVGQVGQPQAKAHVQPMGRMGRRAVEMPAAERLSHVPDEAGRGRDEGTRCPACFAPSYYIAGADRYAHRDGSANDRCWLALLRGEVA